MKRIICLLLVFALCLPLILTSCKGKLDPIDDDQPDQSENNLDDYVALDKDDADNGDNKKPSDQGDQNNDENQDDDVNDGGNQDDGDVNGGTQTPSEPDVDLPAGAKSKYIYTHYSASNGTNTVQKKLLPDSVSAQMKAYVEGSTIGSVYVTSVAPFVLRNNLGMSNVKLTSITIPVKSTGNVDGEGNFIFTLSTYPKLSGTSDATSASPTQTAKIKISAATHGLSANQSNINKVITVDISSYNIYVDANETLGFSCYSRTAFEAGGDTLLPLFLYANADGDTSARNYFASQCAGMKGFYGNVGLSAMGINAVEDKGNVLYFDFTYETTDATLSEETYDDKAEFEAEVTKTFSNNGGKLIASYMTAQLREMVENRIAQKEVKAATFYMPSAPFVPNKDIGLSGTRLTSITIPVMATGTAVDGNYTFTLSIINKNAAKNTSSAIVGERTILISKNTYGLTDNNDAVYKIITVDLTAYNLVIGANETVGFGKDGDTLKPIYVEPNGSDNQKGFYKYLKGNDVTKNWIGFDACVGTAAYYSDGSNALLFDFTYEKTYSSVSEYMIVAERNAKKEFYYENFDEMLQSVKDAYGGKQLSIMGDSISTYKDIANNTAYNSTIGGNAIWYGDSAIQQGGFGSYKDTYWGNMLRHIEMKLCVDNAWSGDSLCGSGRAFGRAQNLHNDIQGINPDLILVYYGINDTWGEGKAVGDLYTLLQNRGDKTRKQVVEEWIGNVIAKAEANGFANNSGSYSSWSEAYAIMLYLMTQKYSNAKIVLFELVENGSFYSDLYVNANTLVPQYNEVINALAAYFGMPVVKQYSVINSSNYEFYTHDWYLLHPNAAGHELMFKELIYTLYTDLQKNK